MKDWTDSLENWLPKEKYKQLAVHSMVGTAIVAYVKDELVARVSDVLLTSVPTGMMGVSTRSMFLL